MKLIRGLLTLTLLGCSPFPIIPPIQPPPTDRMEVGAIDPPPDTVGDSGFLDSADVQTFEDLQETSTPPTDARTEVQDTPPQDSTPWDSEPTDSGALDIPPVDVTPTVDVLLDLPVDRNEVGPDVAPVDTTPVDVPVDRVVDATGVDVTTVTDVHPDLPCPSGETRCGEVCVDLLRNPENCGACNRPCSLPHTATSTCSGGCAPSVCLPSYADCNHVAVDGCEINTSNDVRNCGSCGTQCPLGQVCSSGSCGCPAGRTLCGTTCVDTNVDITHCGSCNPCPFPVNSTPTCSSGSCGVNCNYGYILQGGLCVAEQRSCRGSSGAPGCGLIEVQGDTFTFQGTSIVTLGQFAIDRTEVTVSRFRSFWAAGHPIYPAVIRYPSGPQTFTSLWNGATEPGSVTGCNWNPSLGRDNHPMNCVNWDQAQAFCVWDGGRLPTEAEWEYVATHNPWTSSCVGTPTATGTCPVPSSGSVAQDLAGNAQEWTAEGYQTSYGTCWGSSPWTDPFCNDRLSGLISIRGGWWSTSRTPTTRDWRPSGLYPTVGFRCVRSR